MKTTKSKTNMKTKSKTPTKINWPAEWDAAGGWPQGSDTVPGDGRTWSEMDEALKAQGTSLEDICRKLGMP